MDWLKRFITGKILKSYLDKLPFNRYKTVISIALYLVVKATQGFCLAAPGHPVCIGVAYLPGLLDIDLSKITDEAAGAALITAAIGALHKLLKLIHKDEELPPAKQ